jgi:hypothetical protein
MSFLNGNKRQTSLSATSPVRSRHFLQLKGSSALPRLLGNDMASEIEKDPQIVLFDLQICKPSCFMQVRSLGAVKRT